MYYWLGADDVVVSDSLRRLAWLVLSVLTDDYAALDSYLAGEFFPAPTTSFRQLRKLCVEGTCTLDLLRGSMTATTDPRPTRSAGEFELAMKAFGEVSATESGALSKWQSVASCAVAVCAHWPTAD